ncbi:protocatechuate 3,4-dioxygenase [Sorangium sp. So ce385]|uniref:dioxygenase family protein n=1 Tax=Sorangium sp. So ce385 TaxID=3133308 RepID=UPI003F5B6286
MRNDPENDGSPRRVTRRTILGGMGLSLLAVPLGQLIACGPADEHEAEGRTDSVPWATGGTAAMTAASAYPDPFAAGPGAACKLTCEQVLGPCYAATLVRKDISEGQHGLPVRLAFLVLDESCTPIPGAEVDIWHSGPSGHYSGDDAHPFCAHDDPDALAGRWFRGVQTTDERGRVDFDTCFPGWYPGRSIHIHFTVRVGGKEHATSQLYFDDAVVDAIVATQPLYDTRGARDTRNTDDLVVDQDQLADFTFQTERMPDGAMLAWKALIVRSSTDAERCDASSEALKELIESGVDLSDPSTFPEGFP